MPLEIATQFWPWDSIVNLVSYGRQALEKYPFEQIWMCDEFQYEDCTTILSSMAMNLDVSVGSMVTFPWRNPLELAQRFASISKLTRPGKEVAVGIGAGGAVQVQVVAEKRNPAAVMRESVEFLTGLLSGKEVELARFPELAKRFRYNTKSKTHLYFPPSPKVPVFLAAGGPRLYEIAGRYADGVIFSQLVARTSLPGIRAGLLKQALESVEAARQTTEPARPFKKIYNLHISIARDGNRAKQWAKRNASYGLSGAYIRYPEVLTTLGLDPKEVGLVAEAYVKGLGVDEAAKRVSDDLLRRAGNVVAGTPDECVEMCREIVQHITALGFDQLVMGVPLGPDVPEAIELIAEKVLPALKLTTKKS